jgi:hypothetical protein
MLGRICPQLGRVAACGSLAATAIAIVACSSGEPPRTADRLQKELVVRDIPDVLRGTIGAETTLRGIEPVLVSGFGIVVGLNGTGGNANLDPAVQSTMERELARGGVGIAPDRELDRRGVSPAQFLRDKNVAVVIVEAAIAPATPKGTTFDVRVRALPNSEVTSLEGGTLWTTDLRIGPATPFEGYKTHLLAQARGPIFVNAFADPTGGDAVSRTVGRVIGGGSVFEPLRIQMVLDNESHSRARSILAATNTRFPEGRYDEGPIAVGRDGSSLAIRVPYEYRDDPQEFIRLLQATRIDQSLPQEWACRYVEELKTQPELAEPLSWCLRALGDMSVRSGCLHPMYEYPEIGPRLAALEAGAELGDARVVPYLKELADAAPSSIRAASIDLMGDMVSNPQVGLALRQQLDAQELDIRVAAYEALAKRGDPLIERRTVGIDPSRPRFYLDLVPARRPLIYVTQQGQPRIVLFGGRPIGDSQEPLRLKRPLLVSAWNNRLMLSAESANDPIRLFYAPERKGRPVEPVQIQAADKLIEMIVLMAHQTTPDDPAPGLDMTFSEVVGALYEIQKQHGIDADFATEADRLGAEVYQASRGTVVEDRPLTTEGEDAAGKIMSYAPKEPGTAVPVPQVKTQEKRSLLQPIPPVKKKE